MRTREREGQRYQHRKRPAFLHVSVWHALGFPVSTMADFRYAIRSLRASPGFTTAALLVLALGIGANGAMFALINAVLLKPLPVRDPGRLAVITWTEPDSPDSNYSLSYPDFCDLRRDVRAFSGMLAFSGVRLSVNHNGATERAHGEIVTSDFFQTLGVRPYLGRLLQPDDDRARGASPVAVLDYGYWQHLGGDRALIGRSLLVNDRTLTVVGVTPPEFYGTDLSSRCEVYVPMSMATVLRPNPYDPENANRGHQWLTGMARLAPGASMDQARAEAAVVFRRSGDIRLSQMAAAASTELQRRRVRERQISLRPGAQGTARLRRNAQKPMLLLTGTTATLLLIACANLGNLLLARGAGRQRELSLRIALGGSRVRLVRQLLVESLVLAAGGGAAGLLVSGWITGAILALLPPGNALGTDLAPEPRVIAATLGLSLLTALLFGLLPAWRSTRQDPAAALKSGAPSVAGADGHVTLRAALIVAQVAMSFVLLVGAGLFLRTLGNLQRIDTGFARQDVFVATVDPSLNGYGPARVNQLLAEFVQRVEAIPGIKRAGISSVSPITGSWDVNTIAVEGYQPGSGEEPSASVAAISPGYLEAMGIPLLQGRAFTWRDSEGSPLVAIINETMARKYFGSGSPLGRHFSFDKKPVEVVGVVRDGKYVSLREEETPRFAYLPFLQQTQGEMVLHARTDGDPLRYTDRIRQQLRAVDSTVPLSGVSTLERQIDESLTSERILATLGGAFGVLALLLAAVGLYGVLAFSVVRRTREIGVRMALGARPLDVSRLVLRQMAVVVLCGVVAGAACALALQGVLRNLLYGVSPADPMVFVLGALLVGSTAAVAAALPASRASHLDPLVALRQE